MFLVRRIGVVADFGLCYQVYNDTFSAAMAEWKGKTAEYKEHHENGSAPAASAEATKPAAAKPVRNLYLQFCKSRS